MCVRLCKTPSYLCICIILLLHAIIAISLIMALVTRYVVYRPTDYYDMPNDMRIVGKETPSIFCSSHTLQSHLTDTWDGDTTRKEINSNSKPQFDVYLMDSDPSRNISSKKTPFTMRGAGQLLTGKYQYHQIYFLPQSNLSISVCTQYPEKRHAPPSNTSSRGLFVYFIKTKTMLREYVAKTKTTPNEPPCIGKDCPYYMNVIPSEQCYEPPGTQYYLNVSADVEGSYYILYCNPDQMTEGQAFSMVYKMNRTQYNISGVAPVEKKVGYYSVSSDKYIMVQFNHTVNVTGYHLYQTQLTYVCDTNMIIYVGIFFFIPMAVIIVLGVILVCFQNRQNPTDRLLSAPGVESADEDNRGLLGASTGYGSRDVTFR